MEELKEEPEELPVTEEPKQREPIGLPGAPGVGKPDELLWPPLVRELPVELDAQSQEWVEHHRELYEDLPDRAPRSRQEEPDLPSVLVQTYEPHQTPEEPPEPGEPEPASPPAP